MDKKRAVELLIQAVDEIPHLKTLHYQNDEIKLWLDKVGNILRAGLKPEDYSKYWPVSQELEILKGVYEDNIYQEEYLRKITNCEIALKSILLKYEILGEISKSPINLFEAMQFHPKIVNASRALFEDGHYAQAIFEAFKAVENFVQDKSDLNLYGTNLMETVFNEENPIIKVPEAGHYYKDVQRGFKHLFIGAAQAIRNPKAHKEIIQKDPYVTLEYLGFASFLLKRIDYWEESIS